MRRELSTPTAALVSPSSGRAGRRTTLTCLALTLAIAWLPCDATALPQHAAREQGPSSTAATELSSVRRRGTWVWHHGEVLDEAHRRALVAFARDHELRVLYLHAAAEYEQPEGFRALLELIRDGRQNGIEIIWVAGDPSWCLPQRQARALEPIRRVVRLNQLMQLSGVAPIDGVAFDIEPHTLAAWKHSRAPLLRDYLQLLELIAIHGRAAGLVVWHTIPSWFSEQHHLGVTLDRAVMDRADGVIVMAYRSTVSDVQRAAAPTLRRAESSHTPAMVAIETKCSEPRSTTFCGTNAHQFDTLLSELDEHLETHPAYAGLVVHHYGAWRALRSNVTDEKAR